MSEEDKFLLIYVILKLRLIRGKCLIFVNDIDRSYRLKLFLEQFGLRTCVLNEELPVNSRFHIVQEFNKGRYDYIIATDANQAEAMLDRDEAKAEAKAERGGADLEDAVVELKDAPAARAATARKKGTAGAEYGVSRGIDFVAVACVVNFDLPTSVRSYVHRIGRTARAGNTGTALSFVVPRNEFGKNKAISCPTCKYDERIWAKISKNQQQIGAVGADGIRAWRYDKSQVDAFRYRMEDALRSVTRSAIKEARIAEIKHEILNSKALKAHFEENPKDLEYLRHDKALHPVRNQQHLRHVPGYLKPRIAGIAAAEPADDGQYKGYVAKNNPKKDKQRHKRPAPGKAKRRKKDPLRSLA